MGRCDKFSEDEVESGVRSTSADTLSDQPLSEWPAGREADRTLAQRTAAVGLTDRGSLSEFALTADHPLRLADDMVRTSAVRGEASLVLYQATFAHTAVGDQGLAQLASTRRVSAPRP
jgi:hypothetical protein